MKLPLAERRRQMAEQAEQMAEYYAQGAATAGREEWQGGDIVDCS
jgi:hypothetical protein